MRIRVRFQKIICFLLAFAICTFGMQFPSTRVEAAALTLSISSSSINVGQTVNVTVTVPSGYAATVVVTESNASVCELQSGSYKMNLGDAAGQPTSGTLTFKAVAEGSCTFTVRSDSAGDENGNEVAFSEVSKTVSVVAPTSGGNAGNGGTSGGSGVTTASSDNTLSSIILSSGTLSPEFSSGTTEYTTKVDYSVTSLAISATPTDSKARVTSVTGNDALEVGENTVKVTVKAEDGTVKTYTITVTRRTEDDPENQDNIIAGIESIEPFSFNGMELHVTLNVPTEGFPEDFVAGSIKIGDVDVPCFSFENGELILLYLLNGEGESGSYYVYDAKQNAVYPFIKIVSEKSYLIFMIPEVEIIPDVLEEKVLSIEGKGVITAYQWKTNHEKNYDPESPDNTEVEGVGFFAPETVYADEVSDLYYVYGLNKQGNKSWYQYDSVEGTYIRCMDEVFSENGSQEDNKELKEKINDLQLKQYMLMAACGLLVLILLLTIINFSIFRKIEANKELSEDLEEEEKEEVLGKDESIVEEPKEEEIEKTNKEKQKKEKKRKKSRDEEDEDFTLIDL